MKFTLICLLMCTMVSLGRSQVGVCPRNEYYTTYGFTESFVNGRPIYQIRSLQSFRIVEACCPGFVKVNGVCRVNCTPPCQNGGMCFAPGFCQCLPGWTGPFEQCSIDVNECWQGICGRAKCINTQGSYWCFCSTGYVYDVTRRICNDVDECSAGTDDCSHTCENTVGGFRCGCPTGYSIVSDPRRRKCGDINECLVDNDCDQSCVNTEGSYYCTCNDGFNLDTDGTTCNSINFCGDRDTNNCSQLCIPLEGGFSCSCNDGYQLENDLATCSDIDECEESFTGCQQICENTVGSFQCSCQNGFNLLPNGTCEDIDECDLHLDDCDQLCLNTYGGFECRCNENYILTAEGKCEELTCAELHAPLYGKEACNATSAFSIDTVCEFSCNPGYMLVGSQFRMCLGNATWSGSSTRCVPLTCPPLVGDKLSVLQPCSFEFNRTCIALCSDNHYLDRNGTISTSMNCELLHGQTQVSWTPQLMCIELDACKQTPGPCKHGTCNSQGRDSFTCSCDDTGYTGSLCQHGIIQISKIPPINVSSPFEITIQARPDSGLDIDIHAPPEVEFQSVNKLSFNSTKHVNTLNFTVKRIGQYQLLFEVTGQNRIEFLIPDPIQIVVIDPDSQQPSYYDSYGSTEGIIEPSCCETSPIKMCSVDNFFLMSSCSWNSDNGHDYYTSGIVFSNLDNFNLPLSVGGASIHDYSQDTFGLLSRDSVCECAKCDSSCYCYNFQPTDIVKFYEKEALARSFLNSLNEIFPSWLTFTIVDSIRYHSSNSHIVELSSNLLSEGCQQFPQVVLRNNPTMAILKYDGSVKISVNNDETFLEKPVSGISTVICIAVNLCQGSLSPLYISLSDPIPTTIQQLKKIKQHGWDVHLTGIAISKERSIMVDNKGDDSSMANLALQGGLRLHAHLDSVNISFNFVGKTSLFSASLDEIFSGSSSMISGILYGNLKMSLIISNFDNYELSGVPEITHGITLRVEENIMNNCGLQTLQGYLNDSLFTRGSSLLARFLEIPPNLRHGDRYNFDCTMQYLMYTDGRGNVNGMEFITRCHDLRIEKLLFPSVNQVIKFGVRTSNTCLEEHFQLHDSLANFPVIALASSRNSTKLGNFVELKQPHITYGLDFSENVFMAIIENATFMMFNGEVTTNIHVTNSGLIVSLVMSVFNSYQFHMNITAPVTHEWSSIEYFIHASAVGGPGSLIDDLEKGVLNSLERKADTALSRVKNARSALTEVQQLSTRLQDSMESVLDEIFTTDRFLSILENETSLLNNSKSLIMERLDIISTETVEIRHMLADSCVIMTCNETCAPGFENTTCIDTIITDVLGPCDKEVIQNYTERHVVRKQTVPCEGWAALTEVINNCGCDVDFQNCACRVVFQENQQCVPTNCTIIETADVIVQKIVSQPSQCINHTEMDVQRPCSVMSDCAISTPDEICLAENSICYNMTNTILEKFNATNKEAVRLLFDLQVTNRQLAATTLKVAQFIEKRKISTTKLEKIESDIAKLSNSTQLVNYNRVVEANKAGLHLAELVNSSKKLFNISDVYFELSVKSEYPQIMQLHVSIQVLRGNTTVPTIVSVFFNFGTKDTSLANAARIISHEIEEKLLDMTPRRRRQNIQQENHLFKLQQDGARLASMHHFFGGLESNLMMLQNASSELHSTAKSIADSLAVKSVLQYMEQTNGDDPELEALFKLKDTLASNILERASLATSNLLPLWQAEVGTFLNESGHLFGQECFGMPDCFVLTMDELTNILDTAPNHVIGDFSNVVQNVTNDLLEISTSTSLPLMKAKDKLGTILYILQGAMDTTYWSTSPPNILLPVPNKFTILENMGLVLECDASYNPKFPVHFQWKKDGSTLPLSNNSILSITSASLSDMGNYTCVVSNHAGLSESLPISVTVVQAPEFYLEPFNQTVTTGAVNPAKLQCNATSVPNPQFKWYFRSKDTLEYSIISDMRGNELHIEDPKSNNEGWYKCEAWIKYNETYNISVISRPAYVSVVDSSVTVMSIPIKINMELSNSFNKIALQEKVRNIAEKIISESLPQVRPTFTDLSVKRSSRGAIVSALVNTRNASFHGLVSKQTVAIARELSNCRRELFKVLDEIKISLSSPTNFENVTRAVDESEYGYVFRCPPGQQLDDKSFILCNNCPPGTYQSKTTKAMVDSSGLEFTVDQQNCLLCPRGTYQPNQGSTTCVNCLSGISHVEGAITSEHCVAQVAFERNNVQLTENASNPEICIRKFSELDEDHTVTIQSCQDNYVQERFSEVLLLESQHSHTCLSLNITDDEVCERDKRLVLCMSPTFSNTIIGNPDVIIVTIRDDDCVCPFGYRTAPNGFACIDVNECIENTHSCSHGCLNTVGSFNCTCPKGLTLGKDIKNCEDIDECTNGEDKFCSHECVNTEGSFYCTCPGGYELSDNSYTCADIDECTRGTDNCTDACENTEGSYYCTCPGGYQLKNDSYTCVDIDECTKDKSNCSHGCVNTEGFYYCTCPGGYQLKDDSYTCVDTDECTRAIDNCNHGCVNTEGSHFCTCHSGYVLSDDGYTCIDLDECTTGTDNCTDVCENTEGSYFCTCPGGYELKDDSYTCVDIDECTKDSNKCSHGCVNTEGSHYCTCHSGYVMSDDGYTCGDIDECSQGTDNCTDVCENTEGSYYCTCPGGYELNGNNYTCVDIDECTKDTHNCSHGCENAAGLYHCTCLGGYELSDDTCADIDECTKAIDNCTHECVNTDGSYHCACPDGYELTNNSYTCIDIDECTKAIDNCNHGCVNTEGSHHCTCHSGYVLSDDTCVDLDECTKGTDNCTDGCENTEGSYYCTCPGGYEIQDNAYTCVDINECTKESHNCSHTCENTPGSYNCTCPDRYELSDDSNTCVATCKPECHNGGICSNHVCVCPIGWSGSACEIDLRCQRNFYLTYFKNWLLPASLNAAVIVAYSEGTGLVTIKSGSRVRKKSLSPGLPIVFQVTEAVNYFRSYQITVQSNSAVELFSGSFNRASAGAFKLFPAEGMYFQSANRFYSAFYRYFAISAPPDISGVNGVVSIVPIADNTTVTIKLTADATIYRSYTKGSIVTIHARKNQPIPIVSANGDLTGTEMMSNKPLAVYSGHECATIPTHKPFCDQIVEEIPPVSTLGTKYIASPFADKPGGVTVKVLATDNHTAVTIRCNGKALNVLLHNVQSYLFTTPSNQACYISASHPVLVAQFSTGGGDVIFGDPSMVILPPIEGFNNNSIVYSFDNDRAMRNYISVITPEVAVKNSCISIDGIGISRDDVISVPINGSFSFNVVRISVSPGIHKVKSSCGVVGVLAYGFSPTSAYAYCDFVQALACDIED